MAAPDLAAQQKDLRTVFVRGISFDADEKALETAFSDVGPVKQCFLVRVKGQAKHKGFGFIQFALAEDAERAVQELNGKAVAGRKLQVELANKRAPLEERKRKRRQDQAAEGANEGSAGAADGAADGVADAAAPAAGKRKQPAKPAGQPAGRPAELAGASDAADAPAANAAAAAPAVAQQEQPQAKLAKRPRPTSQPGGDAAAGGPGSEKHKLLRAVALGNLVPQALTPAMAMGRAAGPVEEILNPAPPEVVQQAKLEADGCTGLVMVVIYKTVKDAMTAVSKLHNQKVSIQPGGGKKTKKAKAADSADADDEAAGQQYITLWAREVKGEGAHVKQWRVILRNLPFKVAEEQLSKALQPAGFVWELKLPRGPDGRPKGFAFASFTCRAHAEKAIALLNGKDLGGRMVVVDWAVPKTQYDAMKKKQEPAAEDRDEGAAGADKSGSDDDEMPSGDGDVGSDDDDGEADEDDDDVSSLGFDDDERGMSEGDGGDDDDGNDGEEAADAEERGMLKGVLSKVLKEHGQDAAGTAVAAAGGKVARTKEQQQQPPAKQQPARQQPAAQPAKAPREEWQGEQAVDVEDEAAARSRPGSTSKPGGESSLVTTVFVRGLPLDATREQLQARMEVFGPLKACRVVIDKASGKLKGTAFVEFQAPETAKKAADACARGRRHEGPGITLAGRQLEVDVAVSQTDARALSAAHASGKTAPIDRRNMYLAKEGHITEGSPAWMGMSAHDQTKRKRAAEEKNQKLRSPNFVISRTRLNVRSIPYGCTEGQLRDMFIKAVRAHASRESPRVKQCKILREEGRYDEDGKRRSKGMGFVEFEDHTHALAAMRHLNNNPNTAWGKDRRPIIEFAIENVKVLKKIEEWKVKAEAKKRQQGDKGAAATGGDDGDGQQQQGQGRASEDGDEGAEARPAKKQRRGQQPREAVPVAANGSGKVQTGGGGDGDGGDGQQQQEGQSKRQRKRLKQKERLEQKKALLKEGGVKALISAVEAIKAGRQQQQQQGAGGTGAAAPPEGAAAKPQQRGRERDSRRQQRQGRQQQQGGRTERNQQLEDEDNGAVRQRKRQADREMDVMAEEGLAAQQQQHGSADGHKRRRKSQTEGGDRLDRLVEQYKAKLDGGGSAGSGRKPAAGPSSTGKARAVASKPKGAPGKATAGGAKASAAGAAVAAAAAAAAAATGIRRWFD